MKKENWERIKNDSPLIFLVTFIAIVANFGFNKGVLNLFIKETWVLILDMIIFILIAMGIAYLILYLFHLATPKK